eukprot:3720577-Lingulodinium_polyedra.AAC.1
MPRCSSCHPWLVWHSFRAWGTPTCASAGTARALRSRRAFSRGGWTSPDCACAATIRGAGSNGRIRPASR